MAPPIAIASPYSINLVYVLCMYLLYIMWNTKYVGLGVFSLPTSLVIERIYIYFILLS